MKAELTNAERVTRETILRLCAEIRHIRTVSRIVVRRVYGK